MDPERVRKPATYADLEALPEHVVGEIVDGELYASPRPAARHASAASLLTGALIPAFWDGSGGGPGGWILLIEPELHLGPDVLAPDLAGWRRTRMPELPDTAAFTLAPDWVCEVVSPRTASLDRVKKMAKYAAAEVAHAWIVDPVARTLEVFRRGAEGLWTLLASWEGDERVRAEPFDALELDLARLWSR